MIKSGTEYKVVKEQPDHGKNHIRSSKELKKGMKVRFHYGEKGRYTDNCTIIKVKASRVYYIDGDGNREVSHTADKGLEPYGNGWNSHNWTERL